MDTQRLIVMALICLFATTAFADQAAPGAGPVVLNGSEPAAGLQVVQLEEMWRAGGEDGDVIFGHIFRATADGDGNVYLVDTQLSEVPVFSPDGEHIKTLSREGEGPGETQEPLDAIFLPDGSLGILQRFPGKVVRIDTEGTPLGDVFFTDATEGGFTALYTGRSSGDQLMFVLQHATREENRQVRTFVVGRYDATGQELARCFTRESVIDFDNPVIREATILDTVVFGSTIGPDGRVYVSIAHDRYSIDVYDPDGSLRHVIERDFTKRPRTDIESGRIQSVFDVWANRGGQILPTEIYDCAPTIADLYVDAANNLWVEHSRSAEVGPDEAMLTYDVFDENGGFVRQVALACEGDPVNDELFRVRDDMVVLVRGSIPAMYASMAGGAAETDDEAAEANMEVVCYRVPD